MPSLSQGTWSLIEPWEALIDERIGTLEGRLIEIRRHLHAHPEPSGEEVETSRFLAAQLAEAGLEPRLLRDGLGVSADVQIGSPGPRNRLIAIRGDIDALRLHDEKECSYRSRNEGVAHSCGHDVHATTVLGAALGAAHLARTLPAEASDAVGARLRFLFQPAEETGLGAKWLVEQGALDNVEGILAMHVDPQRDAGTVGICYGILTAYCDEAVVTISGHGGHAARPHHTIDPIATAGHLIGALYEFLPRAVDARSASVFSVGMIQGGYASNVIPESVELHGTLRTVVESARDQLKERIREICDGAARASGAKVDVDFISPLRAVDNSTEFAAALEGASRHVLGRENVRRIDLPSMGGEDFAIYLDHVPGALLRVGCAAPGADAPFLHSPVFDVDERILAQGAKILLRAALVLSAGRPLDESGG